MPQIFPDFLDPIPFDGGIAENNNHFVGFWTHPQDAVDCRSIIDCDGDHRVERGKALGLDPALLVAGEDRRSGRKQALPMLLNKRDGRAADGHHQIEPPLGKETPQYSTNGPSSASAERPAANEASNRSMASRRCRNNSSRNLLGSSVQGADVP